MTAQLRPHSLTRLATVLQIVLGLFFIASAIGKLIEIDTFEVYLYSFGFFSLPTALVGTRIVIVAELLLGIAIACGIAPRRSILAATFLVLLFTLFLVAALWTRRNGNCHCMGALAPLSAGWSLVKNALLLLLLLLLLRLPLWQWHLRWFIVLPIALLLATGVFALSMPDNWMFGSSTEPFDQRLLSNLADEDGPLCNSDILHGRCVVVMATEGCPYCHKALQKLQTIASRHNIGDEKFFVILPEQESAHQWDDDIPQLQGKRYRISVADFLHLTYGQRPIIVLMDNGTPTETFHYRNIDESRIASFLDNND